MLDSLAPIIEHWYIWLPLLVAIAACYLLEKIIKKGKVIFTIINLVLHTGLIVLCFIFDAGTEIALLLTLIAVLLGMIL